ncbi:unnamed protein product [Debaryomyces tyrocola]|nr:unnamed protein product [Debaryomyces tyrocola]
MMYNFCNTIHIH